MYSRISPGHHSLLALVLAASSSLVAAGPCDIYASGGTPCVAAHSTTRALYTAYSGALYQVIRNSDSATMDISPLSAGGVANAAAQDSFCVGATCSIAKIYDQSGNGNDLAVAPGGGDTNGPNSGGYDNIASAIGAPVTLNGQKAYGVFSSPLTGYRIDDTVGVPTGDDPEGLYAVLDGTHYNSACCFDYGNAEANNYDNGAGHMEAIYFGTGGDKGTGSGPWVQADLENGIFSGSSTSPNDNDLSITYRFVTAAVKGDSGNQWAIHGGDATSGSLTQYYSGARPSGYSPMKKEGSIILGIGGDNSDGAQGTFYEGAMTSGYPSDATEAAVQANIVAAGYAVTSLVSGPAFTVGDTVTFQATTACCTADYISHSGATVQLADVTSSSSSAAKNAASWVVHTGLGNSECFSFESVDTPGSYIRHFNSQLMVNAPDGSALFTTDATFCPESGLDGESTTNTMRSWSFPTRNWRHYNSILYIAMQGGYDDFDALYLYSDDTSFIVSSGFQS